MKRLALFISIVVLTASPSYAGLFDDLMKSLPVPPGKIDASQDQLGIDTVVKGLKQALSVGTGNAVNFLSKKDGYFSNEAVKILLPEKLQTAADVLKTIGYQKEVDEFVLSMNRAAEKAAPKAASIFVKSIKEMNIEEAKNILKGSDTAATEYFKAKNSKELYEMFKPIISSSMSEVGTTRAYKDMVGKYTAGIPFARVESLDLDNYVTNKSLDGLFYMIGQEEKKIRTDPAARVTDLLKKVFGK